MHLVRISISGGIHGHAAGDVLASHFINTDRLVDRVKEEYEKGIARVV